VDGVAQGILKLNNLLNQTIKNLQKQNWILHSSAVLVYELRV
jgi:hypothetical protein